MKDVSEPRVAAEVFSVQEVCALLGGVSVRSVYRNADAGRMPYGFKLGGLRRWRKAELLDWLSQGCPKIDDGQRDER